MVASVMMVALAVMVALVVMGVMVALVAWVEQTLPQQQKNLRRHQHLHPQSQLAMRSCLGKMTQVIAGANGKQRVEEPVRHGQRSLLTGIPGPRKSIQMLDWSRTTAATQMVKTPFGVTQHRAKDGSIVNPCELFD